MTGLKSWIKLFERPSGVDRICSFNTFLLIPAAVQERHKLTLSMPRGYSQGPGRIAQCIESCLGGCLSSCVNCLSYLSDVYTDWKHGEAEINEMDFVQPAITRDPTEKSIHTAVIDRNPSEVIRILKARPEATEELNSGDESALHLACKLGYLDVMSALLENNFPCTNTSIGTPIHCILLAVKTGYINSEVGVNAIQLLATKGCNLDAFDRGQKTALFVSAEQGHLEAMKTLLNLGCDVNKDDSNKFTPLYMSVIRGDLQCVNLLIENLPQQSDVDRVDTADRTPLIAALLSIVNNLKYEKMPNDIYNLNNTASDAEMDINRYNRVAVVEALLRAGADPNATDSLDRSALVIAFIILELDNIHSMTQTRVSTSDVQKQSLLGTDGQDKSMRSTEHLWLESIYTPLVRLLVLSGARLPDEWQKDYSNSPLWMQELYDESQRAWIEQKVQRPPMLLHLSRMAIRAHLANAQHLHHIHRLPLPEKLLNYVSVNYL